MNNEEKVIRSFFEDHEKYGYEVACLKHMHPDCVWVQNDEAEVKGRNAVLEKLRKQNRVFQRPYAHFVVEYVLPDCEKEHTFVTQYEEYSYNPYTGNAFDNPASTIFVLDGDKIIYRKDIFDAAPYLYGEGLQ